MSRFCITFQTFLFICLITFSPLNSHSKGLKITDTNEIITALAPGYHKAYKRNPFIDLNIQFDFDRASLLQSAERQLDYLAKALVSKKLKNSHFQITGHTDAKGEEGYNKRLSAKRAAAVKTYLIDKKNIQADRLFAIGLGEEKLKDISNPEHSVNRRVEISLIPGPNQNKSDVSNSSQPSAAFDWGAVKKPSKSKSTSKSLPSENSKFKW